MSVSQRSLACVAVKSRLIKFSDALVLRESVVTRNRRIALGRIPALCISLATVLRQHGTSCAISSTCTLGAPYDSRLAWWIVRIRAVRPEAEVQSHRRERPFDSRGRLFRTKRRTQSFLLGGEVGK